VKQEHYARECKEANFDVCGMQSEMEEGNSEERLSDLYKVEETEGEVSESTRGKEDRGTKKGRH